jgi:hypothetical protein
MAFKGSTINRIHGHDIVNSEHVQLFERIDGGDFCPHSMYWFELAPALVRQNDLLAKSKSAGSTSSFHKRRG